MYLCDGTIGNNYKVQDIKLPVNIEKRLEALGMTRGTPVTVLNSKGHGILIVKIRGTRFALGRNITKKLYAGIDLIDCHKSQAIRTIHFIDSTVTVVIFRNDCG